MFLTLEVHYITGSPDSSPSMDKTIRSENRSFASVTMASDANEQGSVSRTVGAIYYYFTAT